MADYFTELDLSAISDLHRVFREEHTKYLAQQFTNVYAGESDAASHAEWCVAATTAQVLDWATAEVSLMRKLVVNGRGDTARSLLLALYSNACDRSALWRMYGQEGMISATYAKAYDWVAKQVTPVADMLAGGTYFARQNTTSLT